MHGRFEEHSLILECPLYGRAKLDHVRLMILYSL